MLGEALSAWAKMLSNTVAVRPSLTSAATMSRMWASPLAVMLRGRIPAAPPMANEEMAELDCIDCHDDAGANKVLTDTCSGCHEDSENILQKGVSLKAETAGRLESIRWKLDRMAEAASPQSPYVSSWVDCFGRNVYLYLHFESDRSLGMHNPMLVREMLPRMEANLKDLSGSSKCER